MLVSIIFLKNMDENQINEGAGGKKWMWVLAAVVVIGVLAYFTGSSLFSSLSAINTNNQNANNQTNISQSSQQQESQSSEQKDSEEAIQAQLQAFRQATEIKANGLTCYDNLKYFLIAKDGSNNIVKYKTDSNQNIPCEYIVGENDFKSGAGAEYFMSFDGKFLLTDSGTAPGCRGLTVYDLDKKRTIYKDTYCTPVTIDGSIVSYWTPTKVKPDNTNCPNLSEYLSQTGSAEIESHVSLNLDTLVKKDFGESRCSVTQ
jgi:type II secretory pathway pseudopilin PulG